MGLEDDTKREGRANDFYRRQIPHHFEASTVLLVVRREQRVFKGQPIPVATPMLSDTAPPPKKKSLSLILSRQFSLTRSQRKVSIEENATRPPPATVKMRYTEGCFTLHASRVPSLRKSLGAALRLAMRTTFTNPHRDTTPR